MIKEKKKAHLKVTVHEQKAAKAHSIESIKNCYFPFQPYPQQINLIKLVHETVSEKKNALIESPTGTGKTLCMLVGALSSLVDFPKPKVYYLTRTHSQISQVIDELKQTAYKCKANIIASRQQLCINPNFQQLKGRMLDKACQQLCEQKLCKFRQVNDQKIKESMRVDELKEKGKKNFICPYYLTKGSTQFSEITIMPFNYLLDWNLFQRNNFSLKDSVIIFDEAHNIDNLAQEGNSFEFSTQSLTHALRQIKSLEQGLKCRYLHKKFAEDDDHNKQVEQCKYFISNFCNKLKEIQKQTQLTNKYDILNCLKQLTTYRNPSNDQKFTGIDMGNYDDFIYSLGKIQRLFTGKRITSEYFQFFKNTFIRVLAILDSDDIDHYSVSIFSKETSTYFRFQCLNASFAFQKIKKCSPMSIIMCSGTLGPLDLWQSDLNIKFHNQLSIPSFMSSNQIFASILGQSQNNEKYDFSYQKKNRQNQYEHLANEFKNIQNMVPNGIVVAFSTYQLMEKTMPHCLNLKKKVFYESKNSNAEFVYKSYSKQARENGAFLFIIMKGRYAEGINFNDELCRCLIVVGIPFLPLIDFKVGRKKAYIQQNFDKDHADQWYINQTFKTVNQALGRVIRSKSDYGSIILIDNRYNRDEMLQELPNWFKRSLRSQSYHQGLSSFFQAKPWLKQKQQFENQFSKIKQKTTILPKKKKNGKIQQILSQQTANKVNRKKNVPKRKLMLKQDSESQDEEILQQTLTNEKIIHPWETIDFFLQDQIVKDNFLVQDQEEQVSQQESNIKNFQKFKPVRKSNFS